MLADVSLPAGGHRARSLRIVHQAAQGVRGQVEVGIGPALARGILTLREERGGFRLLEELMDVNGIGEKRFMALKEFFFCPMQGNYLPASPPSF